MKLSELGVKREEFKLSNGMPCVVFERQGMPVHVRLAFKAGSRYDTPGKEGLAHYLEHMVVAGTKKYPTKSDLATYIEQYGGGFGASTPKETIQIRAAVGDPEDLEIAFDVLGQMMTESLFEPRAVENERQSVLGEIGEWEGNPGRKMWDIRYRLYFQGTSVGRSGVGTVEGVEAVNVDDLKNFLKETLTSDRGIVVVSGGVDAESVKKIANEKLRNLGRSTKTFDDGEVKVVRTNPVLIVKKDNKQLHLTFGFRTCPKGDPDWTPLDVIGTILGGGRASTLNRILRQEQGLVYSVGTQVQEMSAGGWWSVETTAAKSKLQAVLDATCMELARVYDGKITAEELEFAKNKMIKSARVQMQTSGSWADYHISRNLQVDIGWTLEDYWREIEEVTLEDLKRVGKKYFARGTWYLGLIGDVTEGDFTVNY